MSKDNSRDVQIFHSFSVVFNFLRGISSDKNINFHSYYYVLFHFLVYQLTSYF